MKTINSLAVGDSVCNRHTIFNVQQKTIKLCQNVKYYTNDRTCMHSGTDMCAQCSHHSDIDEFCDIPKQEQEDQTDNMIVRY